MNQPEKLQGADGVRGLACLWVVAHHVFKLLPQEVQNENFFVWVLCRGERGVPIFFVLSGFLLSMPLLKGIREGSRPRWDVYMVRRLGRIVPGYYACLVLCALAQSRTNTPPDWTNVWLSLGFVNSFFPRAYYPLWSNKALWSIGVEVIFYLLLPLFMTAAFRCRSLFQVRALWLVVTVGLVLGNCFFVEAVHSWRGGASPTVEDQTEGPWRAVIASPIALFAHFLVGLLAADLFLSAHGAGQRAQIRAVASPRLNAFDAIACLCLLFTFTLDVERWVPGSAAAAKLLHLTYDFPVFHLLVAALLVAASLSGFAGRALDNRFLRATATLSFGIYLWHLFLLLALGRIDVSRLQPATIGAALVTFAIVLSLSFVIAAASYFFLERPVLARAHLYKPSPTRVPLTIGREPPESA